MLSSIAYAANSDGKRKFSDIPFSEILYSDMSASLEEEGCNGVIENAVCDCLRTQSKKIVESGNFDWDPDTLKLRLSFPDMVEKITFGPNNPHQLLGPAFDEAFVKKEQIKMVSTMSKSQCYALEHGRRE